MMEEQALQHLYDLVGGEEARIGIRPLQGADIEQRVYRIMRSGDSVVFSLGTLLNAYQQQFVIEPICIRNSDSRNNNMDKYNGDKEGEGSKKHDR